jgi:hypothetical protein
MLKPRNLIQAAEADLRRRAHNKRVYAENLDAAIETYAFYAPHVRAARDAKHLIEIAIARNSNAALTKKKNTRLIYDNVALLREALDACA